MKLSNVLKIAAVAVLFVIFAQAGQMAHAQSADYDDFGERVPYFVISGGYIGTFHWTDFSFANSLLGSFVPGRQIRSPLFLSGAQVLLAIGIVDDVRVGFSTLSGSRTITEEMDGGAARTFLYDISFSGFSLDYALWRSNFDLILLPSVAIGWGGISIAALEADGTLPFDPTQPQIPPQRGSVFKTSYVFIAPTVQLEYIITAFAMIRLQASYSATFLSGGGWQLNNSAIDGVAGGAGGSGFGAQIGLFLGLFNN